MAQRIGVAIFVFLAVLVSIIGMSGEEGPVGAGSFVEALSTANRSEVQEQIALRGTFVLGTVVFSLGVTIGGLRRGQRWAWWALWYWPIFFVLHAVVFDTYLPDIPFALLAAVGLGLTRRALTERKATTVSSL